MKQNKVNRILMQVLCILLVCLCLPARSAHTAETEVIHADREHIRFWFCEINIRHC